MTNHTIKSADQQALNIMDINPGIKIWKLRALKHLNITETIMSFTGTWTTQCFQNAWHYNFITHSFLISVSSLIRLFWYLKVFQMLHTYKRVSHRGIYERGQLFHLDINKDWNENKLHFKTMNTKSKCKPKFLWERKKFRSFINKIAVSLSTKMKTDIKGKRTIKVGNKT